MIETGGFANTPEPPYYVVIIKGEEESLLFVNKKKQKNFGTRWHWGNCACDPTVPRDRRRTGGNSAK